MQPYLTDSKIAKLSPGRHPDGKMPGLELTVAPSRVMSWSYRYRIVGRSRHMTLARYPNVTPDDARRAASIVAGAVAQGRDPGAERKAERQAVAVAAAPITDGVEKVAAAYLRFHKARVRAGTYRETARVFAREILPVWHGRRLGEITKADVRKLVESVAKCTAKGVSGNRLLTSLKTFFAYTVEHDVIPVSPCASVRQPAPESPRERVLDDGELAAVLAACTGLGEYGQGVKLLALTGARRQEVFGASWSEFDMAARVWTLPAARAKNNRQHSVPLSEQAVDVLRWLAPGLGELKGPVFEEQSFSRMKGLIDAALPDMPPWCVHDLRRTAASGMAGLGVQPHVIEACLNHKSGAIRGVAAIYNRFNYASEKRHALDAWAQHVETIQRGLESFSAAA
jgi:integrase